MLQATNRLLVGTVEGNLPIVGQGASFLLALAGMEANRPAVMTKQDFKPAIRPLEEAGSEL